MLTFFLARVSLFIVLIFKPCIADKMQRASRENRGAPRGGRRPPREEGPRVWQPRPQAKSDNLSFEDMMSRFKSQSESKLADLDHESGGRRGGSASRGRRGGR